MFYNSSKIRGRSTELVGALFKGPRLKLAIGGAIVLAVAVTATLAGIFTNISEAQTPIQPKSIGFVDAPAPFENAPASVRIYNAVVNQGTRPFTSTVVTTVDDVDEVTATVTVGVLDGTLPVGEMVTLSLSTADGSVEIELARLAEAGIDEARLISAGINKVELVAKAGIDYVAISGMTITLSSTNPTMDIPITILTTDNNDDVLSPDKIFSVVLSETSLPAGFTLDPARLRTDVAIRDNDIAIGFDERSYSVKEDVGTVEVCVALYHPAGSVDIPLTGGTAIVAVVTTVPGTATEVHYTRRAGFDIALFFDNAGRRECFDIDITDNDVLDGARLKEFYLTLENDPFTDPPIAGGLYNPVRNRVKITIEDDDPAELGVVDTSDPDKGPLTAHTVVVDEGNLATNLTVTVGVLHGGLPSEVATFILSTEDGSAKAGTDYVAISDMEIQVNSQIGTVDIPIAITSDNDLIAEDDKTFNIVLKAKSGSPLPDDEFTALPAGGLRVPVVIKDNDAVIGFEETLITVREGEDLSTRVTVKILKGGLPAGTEAELILDARDVNDDAAATARIPDDFQGVSTNRVTLSNTVTSAQSNSIGIINADTFRSPRVKNFFVDATAFSLPQGATLDPDRSRVEVRIVDKDDPAKIGFENLTYEVIENREMVTLTVKNLGGELISGAVATVRLTTSDGSALAGTNGDYIANTRDIQLSRQMSVVEVTIPIVDNEDEEPDKSFFVDLDVVGSLPFAVELATDMTTAEVTIKDGDATIGFELQSYSILENGGQQEVAIEVKSGKLAEQISVGLRTEPGTAQPGSNNDYIHTEEDLVLSPTQLRDAAVIPINLDRFAEGTERFYAVLSDAGLPKGVKIATGVTRAEVAIEDEIIVTIGFVNAPYSVPEEAGGVTISIEILSEGVTLAKEVKVGYEITIDGVEASEDLQVTTGAVTFEVSDGAGTRRDVWIPVIDDSRIEIDEIFEVELALLTTGTDAIAAQLNPGTANITVTDNESVPVSFGASKYDVSEDAGSVRVQAMIVDASTLPTGYGDVEVHYRIEPGSAQSGADYTDMSGMITLSAANPSMFIEIPIIDDDVPEVQESFRVILSDTPGFEVVAAETLVEILNDDVTLVTVRRVGADSGPVNEGDTIMLEATLAKTGALAIEDLVVTVAARPRVSNPDGGTAADVTILDGMSPAIVMIAMGTSIATFTVSVENDNDAEYAETVNIYVSHVGVGQIMDDGYDLTIASDAADKITVTSLEVLDTTYKLVEEGTAAIVRITLSGTLPDRTPVNSLSLVLSDSANDNLDVAIQALDIASALKIANSVDVTVTLLPDDLLEGPEEIELELQVNSGDPDLADVLDVSGASDSFMLADADSGEVSIVALPKTSYNESEDVTVTVSLPSGLTAGNAITVRYTLGFPSGEASAGDIDGIPSDSLVNFSNSFTIPKGATMAIFTIDLKDDSDVEETEQLNVWLSAAMIGTVDVGFDDTTVRLMILDNEPTEYTFVDGDGEVSEGSNDYTYTVRLRRVGRLPDGGDGMVPYTASGSGSSPASAADFGAAFPTGNFEFSGYDTRSALTMLTVADDNEVEGDETFQIILTGPGRTETHPVTLADNDVPVIDIERVSGSGSVAEGSSVQFIARLVNAAPSGAIEDLTVNLITGAISTVSAGDVRFMVNGVMTSSVRISMGMSETEMFTVFIVDDKLAEFDEQVVIEAESVTSPTLGNNANTGSDYSFEVTSDDKITAEIEVDDTREDAGQARITIKLSQALPENVPARSLMLNLENDTERQDDLSGLPVDVTDQLRRSSPTQSPAEVSTVVMVNLTDDSRLEINEIVRLLLQADSTLMPNLTTLLDDVRGSFEIIDDESGIVQLVPPPDPDLEYYESEGGNNNKGIGNNIAQTLEFEFRLPDGVIADVPVVVYYSMGVAEIGSGSETAYGPVLAPGFAQGLALPRGFAQAPRLSVTIDPGKTRAILRVTLPNDDKAEVTELLTVRLDDVEATGVPRVEVDQSMDETVITILDDEDPVLQIIGSGEIDEDDGSYMVQLRRLGRIDQDGKIPYTIVGQGADEGDFVGALTGDFEFDGYEPVSKQVILILDDDSSAESSKTFQIRVQEVDPTTMRMIPVRYVAPVTYAPYVDPATGMPVSGFAVMLLDSDPADFFGALPPTGGPVLPVWLLVVLLLTGVALLVPALRRI